MELSNQDKIKYARQLQASRLRLLDSHPFYGLLLMHMSFSLDVSVETAYTDGQRIAFNPEFLSKISDKETDFVMMHEILHTALNHCYRIKDMDKTAFDIACDIVVNSNILYSNNMDLRSITTKAFGESMHCLPDGREGYKFSVEEVYVIIKEILVQQGKNGDLEYKDLTSRGKGGKAAAKRYEYTGNDIQDLLDVPNGDDGDMWDNHEKWKDGAGSDAIQAQKDIWFRRMVDATDIVAAMASSIGKKAVGRFPAGIERMVADFRKAQTDWRTILDNFVQEEICDYSFAPPDRRFSETDFFLPDYNEKDENVKNILFMIDTSGSMSDDEIAAAFSEINGAIEQFNGKLEGLLGFFDADVYEPQPFASVDDLLAIRPIGGGGTSFQIIFDYVKDHMTEPPASIIILTDGFADMPKEEAAMGIPVLWLINNEEVTPNWGRVARLKIENN